MSIMWVVFVALAPILSAVAFGFAVWGLIAFPSVWTAAATGVTLLVGLVVPAIVMGFFFYKLIERIEGHRQREGLLRRTMIDTLRARAAAAGAEGQIAGELATMEAIHADASGERPVSGLLAVLSVVPVARWYVLFVLTRWAPQHDQRWNAFATQAAGAASKVGRPFVAATWNPLPKRSFAVYLILSWLTSLVFQIYWMYAFVKDGNDHFETHVRVEEPFAAAMA
jgi:hypothetical protein